MKDIIKTLRKKNKMTQQELGDLLGVTKATIQKYENGGIKNLKQDTIQKLSKIFCVHPTLFLPTVEENLRREVVVIEEIKILYGDKCTNTIGMYLSLPKEGQEKVDNYVVDMIKIYGDDGE